MAGKRQKSLKKAAWIGDLGFYHRVLPVQPLPDGGLVLDAIACADGNARVFFGAEMTPECFASMGTDGCANPLELRGISSGTMVVASAPPTGPICLALASGQRLAVSLTGDETALFATLNCILSFRLAETAEQVAEGLVYHAIHHGLQGALILNRLPDPGFASALEAALQGVHLTVLLLDCPVPLGKPGLTAETHPLMAPDAPGKSRMAIPPPDPWRAPLGEGVLYEALKWRYLARARAVLTLDACDILALRAEGEANAFDRTLAAPSGVTLLVGQRIYPWRVRKDTPASFGDHICRLFEGRRGFARWGVAPEKAGLQNTWRGTRVAYAKPDASGIIPFFRAMALRVPGLTTAELVPKTGLVEDAGLLHLATHVLGTKPVRAPLSQPKPAPLSATQGGRTAIVTTMKNEGPFIMEWIAWHRMIGVDDFLIYTNDCSDGTDALLNILQAKGIVQHRDNPYKGTGLKPQHAALQAAESEPVILNSGWAICMDVDEYINIKIGDGTLAALYAAMGDANMISLTWRLFGNEGVHDFQDRPITEQFVTCAPELCRKPHQAWGFKTLFRNIAIFKKLGVHRPKGLRPDLWEQIRWLNGSGRPQPIEMFRNGWRSTLDSYGYDWVQLNHYACRSAESFLVKRDRGRVNHVDRDQGLNYWFRMNHNAARDLSAQRMLPALKAELARLMADPEIAAAHQICVSLHREKIAALKAQTAQAAFYGELTSPRMEELCRLQPHFGSAVFAEGPHMVPDTIRETEIAPNFFFTISEQAEAAAEKAAEAAGAGSV